MKKKTKSEIKPEIKKELQDTDIMPFGKYNRERVTMQDVPAQYFHWLWFNWNKNDPTCPVAIYIKKNLGALKKENPDLIWD